MPNYVLASGVSGSRPGILPLSGTDPIGLQNIIRAHQPSTAQALAPITGGAPFDNDISEVSSHPDDLPGQIKAIHKQVKASGMSSNQIQNAIKLGASGTVFPGTSDFFNALGLGAEQNGLTSVDSWASPKGVVGLLTNIFDPKTYDLARKQRLATQMGLAGMVKAMEARGEMVGLPEKYSEISDSGLGKLIPPTAEQRANPEAELKPYQAEMVDQANKGLAEGKLIRMPDGSITSPWAVRGFVDPNTVNAMNAQIAGQQVPGLSGVTPLPGGGMIPTALASQSMRQIASNARQQRAQDNPNVGAELNAISMARHGIPFNQATGDQRLDVLAQKEQNAQQRATNTTNNAIRRANATANNAARRKDESPIGVSASKYGKLSPNGNAIEKPPADLPQGELAKQGYVDISRNNKDVDGIHRMNVIQHDFTKLSKYADALFKAEPGAVPRLTQAGRLTFAKLTNAGAPTSIINAKTGKPMTTGELANTYTREVESMLEFYGRHLKGIVGAGTEQDVARMRHNFANVFTSQAVKDRLTQDTQDLINQRRQGMLDTIFGAKANQSVPVNGTKEAATARIRELRSQGQSWDEVHNILKSEGYE